MERPIREEDFPEIMESIHFDLCERDLRQYEEIVYKIHYDLELTPLDWIHPRFYVWADQLRQECAKNPTSIAEHVQKLLDQHINCHLENGLRLTF